MVERRKQIEVSKCLAQKQIPSIYLESRCVDDTDIVNYECKEVCNKKDILLPDRRDNCDIVNCECKKPDVNARCECKKTDVLSSDRRDRGAEEGEGVGGPRPAAC